MWSDILVGVTGQESMNKYGVAVGSYLQALNLLFLYPKPSGDPGPSSTGSASIAGESLEALFSEGAQTTPGQF